MVGVVADASQLRDLLKQCLFNAAFQSHIDRTTALTAATELQHRVQAVEHVIYPAAAGLVASGDVEFRDGEALIDGNAAPEPIVRTFE